MGLTQNIKIHIGDVKGGVSRTPTVVLVDCDTDQTCVFLLDAKVDGAEIIPAVAAGREGSGVTAVADWSYRATAYFLITDTYNIVIDGSVPTEFSDLLLLNAVPEYCYP